MATVLQVTANIKSRKLVNEIYLFPKTFGAVLVPTRRSTQWLAVAPSFDKDDRSFSLSTRHPMVTKFRISEVIRPLPPYAFMVCARKTLFHG